jgi:NAD(P)-dependent dehydrogenase (short-subunit alcohol dehydrogenase family)
MWESVFFSPLAETPVERFDDIIATNLRPVFVTSREMTSRRAGAKRYGRIINIASPRWL